MPAIGVLVPIDPDRPIAPPEERPIGRAALTLASEGLTVVFGDDLDCGALSGLVATPGGWVRAERVAVAALIDRFPSQNRADRYAHILENRAGLPLANRPEFTLLCRDKLRCQQTLEAAGLEAPPVEADPTRFADRLSDWGSAFLKPRYGALGVGVRRVVPGDPLPATLPGVVPGRPDPAILQRAVPPPAGWAGWSVRVLAQRGADERWHLGEPIVRRSRKDPVVNAARGAEVRAGCEVLDPPLRAQVEAHTRAVVGPLTAHPDAIELGVDLVIDEEGRSHVVEVNSRPRGRMEVLARRDPERFGAAHEAACGRPLRLMARRHANWR